MKLYNIKRLKIVLLNFRKQGHFLTNVIGCIALFHCFQDDRFLFLRLLHYPLSINYRGNKQYSYVLGRTTEVYVSVKKDDLVELFVVDTFNSKTYCYTIQKSYLENENKASLSGKED